MANKINYEEVRQAWIRHASAEAAAWLAHIDRKRSTIVRAQRQHKMPIFEYGDLLFNIAAYLNWLGHIDLRNDKHVKEDEIVKWVSRVTNWPAEIAEAFWFCVRNPVMHTGRTFIFSDYDRKSATRLRLFADLHPDLRFDPLRFQPEEFKPSDSEDGWLAVRNPDDERKLEVAFYFPGVRRKLQRALEAVMQNIARADNNSLASLAKVNRKILAFRVTGS